MLGITFLSFMVLWSTSQADYSQDAFETVCIPNQACYYVSKFKTSWETAREMCQEKIQQHSVPYNETDNVILNPLANNLLTKRYWVLEPNNQVIQENPHKITIILNRKRRSVTVKRTTADVNSDSNLQKYKIRAANALEDLLKTIDKQQCDQICKNAKLIRDVRFALRLVKRLWKIHIKYGGLERYRIIRDIKLITDLDWEPIINKVEGIDKVKWITNFKTIIELIKSKQYPKIDTRLLLDFKDVIKKIKAIVKIDKPLGKIIVKRITKYVELLEKWNWPELIKKVDEKDREKITEEIKHIIKLIKEKRHNEIDFNLFTRVKEIFVLLHDLKRKEPLTPKVIVDKVTRYVDLLKKWNWPELVKKIDEKDREKVTKEITNVIKLITENKVKEIDLPLLERLKVVFRLLHKVKPKETDKDTKEELLNKLKFIVNLNWPEIINKIPNIDKVKWTNRIKKLIELIKNNEVDKIDLKWLEKFRKIIKVIHNITDRKPLTPKIIVERVTRYVNLFKKWNWPELVKKIDEKDREKVTKDITNVIKLITENKVKEIDLPLLKRIREIFTLLRRVHRTDKDIRVITETSIKYKDFLEKLKWPELVKFIDEKKRPEVIDKIKEFITLVEKKQFDKIDNNLLNRLTEIVITLNKIKEVPDIKKIEDKQNVTLITEKSIRYVQVLNELKWEELVKYIDKNDRPKVIEKVKKFITFVQNKQFKDIDIYLINWIAKIITSLENINKININNKVTEEKNIKIITENSLKYLTLLKDLKWEELVKFIDETKRNEIVNQIKIFITNVEKKEFNKIDKHLIDYITEIIRKLEKVRKIPEIDKLGNDKNKTIIIETSNKYLQTLTELKWEELVKYIVEKDRPEVVKKINTFITLVKNKEFPKIDANLFNWITRILVTFKEVQKINEKNKKAEEEIRKKITETSVKYVKYLEELKWEELVKYIDENKRPDIIKRVNIFINFVKKKEFDKIDIILFNWITDIITTLKTVKIVPVIKVPDEKNKTILIETSAKYTKLLLDLKWEELLKHVDEKDRPDIEAKIKTFITFVNNKQFDKIDTDLINRITQTITILRKVKEINIRNQITEEKNKKIITDLSLQYITILQDLKWEELTKYIDEKSRIELVTKVKTFTGFVDNKNFDKIDRNLLNWIHQIILVLTKVREINVQNKVTEENNKQIIIKTSVNYFNILKELKWEELTKFIDGKDRETVINKIKSFITFVENKQFEKIDTDLINWITGIVTTLRKIKEINDINKATEEKNKKIITDISLKYIELLNELKWEELVKHIDDSSRSQIVERIKSFITFVNNKQFEKIDTYLINWITEIITTLRKIREINIINKVTDENNKQIIKSTSVNYFNILKELKWEELIKFIGESQRPDITQKVKDFQIKVEKNQFDTITVELLNWLAEIITIFRKIRITNFTSKKTEIINRIQITLPGNWKELLRRVQGIDHNLWIGRITYLLSMTDSEEYKNVNLDWIDDLQRIIQLISQEYLKLKKETFLNEESITKIRESIKLLQEWNWETLLIYIDEKNRQQVQRDVTEMISVSASGNFETLDVQFVKWFHRIFEIFKQFTDAIKNGYVFDAATQTWVKHVVTVRHSSRNKRSIEQSSDEMSAAELNVRLINESISKLQKALLHNMMILRNERGQMNRPSLGSDDQSRMCPFINKVNDKLMTKLTNCAIKQRFICKRQLN